MVHLPDSIQNGQDVRNQLRRDALLLGLNIEIVKRQIKAPEHKEGARNHK